MADSIKTNRSIFFLFVLFSTDLQKLYLSNQLNPNDQDPQFLQNKVQFDICFYFCHHGNKNIYDFTKTTFAVKEDLSTGLHYLVKEQDEKMNNHTETSNQLITAIMTEIPDHPLYPIASYLQYMLHLHPQCPYHWQCLKKKEEVTDMDIWYYNKRVGTNQLFGFLSKLSYSADLSHVYTNHSIRVTAATFLKCCNFSDN